MEAEKLPKTEINLDRDGDRDQDDPERHSHSVTTINDLPAETLAELFGYLTHTEKLISRLVCQKLNDQISSFLIRHSYYSLASRESLQVLLDSHDAGMQWNMIKISNYRFILPSKFKNSITTLEVHMSKFQSKSSEYITFLTEFPSLTTLKMSVDNDGSDSSDDMSTVETDAQAQVLMDHLKTIFEKMKILEITFPFNSYFLVCDFLSKISILFGCCNLDVLHITEKWPSSDFERNSDKYDSKREGVYTSVLDNIILVTLHALKSLTLDFTSKTIQHTLFKTVLPCLNKYIRFPKLESLRISRVPSQENIERDFSTLEKFLRKQASLGKLRNVILPWCPDASLCQDFVRCLPPDIEFFGNLRREHIYDEFNTTFKNLRSVSIESDLILTGEDFDRDATLDNVRRLEIDLRKSRDIEPLSLYQDLTSNWYNLSEIKFIGNGILVFDSDLQQIISDLSDQIRVLHLESCKITDFGVLGVPEDDVELQELINTKRIYYYPQASDQNQKLKVEPLSRLDKLEKLVLVDTNITDVGIILGFKFGLTLKQLILTSRSPKVTDFGLYSLGSYNPGLEAFEGTFKSGKISTVGIEKLKELLPLTEFTRKFKVVNEKPDN